MRKFEREEMKKFKEVVKNEFTGELKGILEQCPPEKEEMSCQLERCGYTNVFIDERGYGQFDITCTREYDDGRYPVNVMCDMVAIYPVVDAPLIFCCYVADPNDPFVYWELMELDDGSGYYFECVEDGGEWNV